MRIITADRRIAERSGVKIMIAGPAGVGKTSLLRTLDADALGRTLFVDIEAGDLAVADVRVAAVRPRRWSECRDLACALGGPNPALQPNACYSQAHYEAVAADFDVQGFDFLFVDSLTAAARLSFTWSEQQPEAISDRGRKDLRAVYGLHAREMLGWLQQLQQARARHVVLVAILEKITDEFNRSHWQFQLEGAKTGRELPGIVDAIVTMQFVDGTADRAFVCMQPNPWGYPAKDRSGRLSQIEKPDLGALIMKLCNRA